MRVWSVFVAMVVAMGAMLGGSIGGLVLDNYFGEDSFQYESFDFEAYDFSDPDLTDEESDAVFAAQQAAFDEWIDGSGKRFQQSMRETMARPRMWVVLLGGSQLGLLIVVLIFARLSKQPMRERLGVKPPGLTGRQWAGLLDGMLVPVAVASIFPTLLQQLFPDLMDMSMFSGWRT